MDGSDGFTQVVNRRASLVSRERRESFSDVVDRRDSLRRESSRRATIQDILAIRSYDFRNAVDKRSTSVVLTPEQRAEVSELRALHTWAHTFQIINTYVDNRCNKTTTDKILEVVPNKEVYREAQGLQTSGRLVTDQQLDILRGKVRKIADEMEAWEKNKSRRSGNLEEMKEKRVMRAQLQRARDMLVASTLNSESFERGEIDLHGLTKSQSINIVYETLRKGKMQFCVVTGQGNHSKNKSGAPISIAISEYLASAGIWHQEEQGNSGRLHIKARHDVEPPHPRMQNMQKRRSLA